jgi:hypothetical protein
MLLDTLAEIIDQRFQNWMFVGSLVDWHYFDGQVIVKDFDIVTSDPFDPKYVCPILGPRYSFPALGRSVDVFRGNPTARIETVEQRVTKLKWISEIYPHRREKCERLIERYAELTTINSVVIHKKNCGHRGEQIRTMTSDICGSRGQDLPVYSCAVHGECTHRQVCKGQDASVKICLGCPDGPWSV